MKILKAIVFALLIIIPAIIPLSATGQSMPKSDPERLKADVCYLTSDELEGRLAGTPACDMAADYIGGFFASIGLLPGDLLENDYFQEFEITTGVTAGNDNAFSISTPDSIYYLTLQTDFIPLYFSSNGKYEGDVVFAGYGITAPKYGWNDYEDLDVAGKAVFILRGEPGQDNPDSVFEGTDTTMYSGLRWKAFNAQSHGAAAMIVATGPMSLKEGEEDKLIALEKADAFGESSIPVVQITLDSANLLFSKMDAPLSMYQEEMERNSMAFGTSVENVTVSLTVDLNREKSQTRNVVGILPGSDPVLKDEYVVVGGHYDHLGWGIEGSLYKGEERQIHNGADDNASGTSAVMEL
ncbi:MAG: M28 family peptidase, partial [bacterium]